MPPKKRAKRAQNDPWGDQPASPGPWDEPGEDPWRFVCCDKAEVSVVSGVPDDDAEQDPWHTEKQDKRDRTINLEAAMQMTVSMSRGKATTSDYDANAANPSRIRTVVGTPCKRKSRKKPGCEKGGLNFTACSKFLDAWASLTPMERSHLLRCCYQTTAQGKMNLVEAFSGAFVARVCAFNASVKSWGPARGPSEE